MPISQTDFERMQARVAPKRELVSDAYKLTDAVTRESDLHSFISDFCRQRGWIAFHGSMAHRAMRTIGEPDYQILADKGRVFLIECKTAKGKLTPEQLGLAMLAEKLGHKIHCIRSMKEFIELTK
jgi:hypothetical protein